MMNHMTLEMFLAHSRMVVSAVGLTILIGVPLGVLAYLYAGIRQVILLVVEVLQIIPTLALLGAILIVVGPGRTTVIIGLLLYSLLPIVQNTYIGLREVDKSIIEVAEGMGMTKMHSLLRVEIPLAFPLIFTGIRIATITAIGIAVFATFVGGGGIGSIIHRGVRVSNMDMVMSGTLTLMAMAVVCDGLMSLIEKRLHRRSSRRPQT